MDVADKMIHSGNRCPDEFLRSEPNFDAIDGVFYYGADYKIREEFLLCAKENWNIIKYKRPKDGGYSEGNTHLTLKTAEELYKYAYSFTTGYDFTNSRRKCDTYYLVAKFFEIMGSGCLLLCDHRGVEKELNLLGFFEGQHYLNINKNNSSKVRKYVTSNPDEARKIRIRAHLLVSNKYTIKKSCEKINSKFRTLL
jgi:hypothetical protein